MIRTKRLSIRRVCANDWKAIQSIWVNESKKWYAQYDRPNALDDLSVQHRIMHWDANIDSDKHMFWAVCKDETVIGYITFNEISNGYEIGYCFHSDYHRCGYAKESIGELLEVIRMQGQCLIVARTALKNIPSISLLTSLKFKKKSEEKVSFYQDEEGRKIYFDGGIFELFL